jgi:midasin (ATPase involved in ribosome maturation)
MKPTELTSFLGRLVRHKIKLSTMIWGPPGIGKSSIVQQTAAAHKIDCIDVRLSQLAPTDLRGLPVADKASRTSRWFPPEFLPHKGRGVLFLDEINLAPPTMQGMAQHALRSVFCRCQTGRAARAHSPLRTAGTHWRWRHRLPAIL